MKLSKNRRIRKKQLKKITSNPLYIKCMEEIERRIIENIETQIIRGLINEKS